MKMWTQYGNSTRQIIDGIDKQWVLDRALEALKERPVYITDFKAPLSEGGPHDYYSNGDYWWPNPGTGDGLPYIRRDGESNPDAFHHHRHALRRMRTNVVHLAAAYVLTGDERYAEKAVEYLHGFFIQDTTRMNPHLLYAQAIPGICPGRGIGIIDTLHLIDVPMAVKALQKSRACTGDILDNLKKWFSDYLDWMMTHPYGIQERSEKNNHGVCWFVQAAVFALFTGNRVLLDFCREGYRKFLLPRQMAADGSFPEELNRTKPYGYSIFVLDNMVTLCHILSTPEDNLWEFTLPDGRSIKKGIEFLYPYLLDKSKWPYRKDIQHFESWPAAMASFLFAGLALGEEKYITLWKNLNPDPKDPEVRRNMAIRQPLLWLL